MPPWLSRCCWPPAPRASDRRHRSRGYVRRSSSSTRSPAGPSGQPASCDPARPFLLPVSRLSGRLLSASPATSRTTRGPGRPRMSKNDDPSAQYATRRELRGAMEEARDASASQRLDVRSGQPLHALPRPGAADLGDFVPGTLKASQCYGRGSDVRTSCPRIARFLPRDGARLSAIVPSNSGVTSAISS